MRLEHVVSLAINQLLGRLFRRAAIYIVAALFLVATIYQLSVAGLVGLTDVYGPIYARLIVAGVDAVIVLLTVAVLYATRAKPGPGSVAAAGALPGPTDARIAMLVESVLLGYSLARNRPR